MSAAVDYILDGLRKNLEVERELGTRTLEFDRGLLAELVALSGDALSAPAKVKEGSSVAMVVEPPVAPAVKKLPFVFLHHAPLKPAAVTMMAKIITAMKATPESAPIVIAEPLPPARYYVALGTAALRRFSPDRPATLGEWVRGGKGEEILLVRSPEEIARFGSVVTPVVLQMKREMWNSLKGLMQKL